MCIMRLSSVFPRNMDMNLLLKKTDSCLEGLETVCWIYCLLNAFQFLPKTNGSQFLKYSLLRFLDLFAH